MTHPRSLTPALALLGLTACAVHHIPPPADLGPPLPPAALGREGLDLAFGGQFLLTCPVAFHLRGARALALGDGPLALELGGNLGMGWVGANPALHLRADLPVGQGGFARMIAMGYQPIIAMSDGLQIFSLELGLHKRELSWER